MEAFNRSAVIGAALMVLGGCSQQLERVVVPNRAPDVHLSAASVPSVDRNAYQYRFRWSGSDPDGRIDHYLYAIDPPSVDRVNDAWSSSVETQLVASFRRRLETESSPREPHVFAVRAVDNRGAMSPVSTAAVAEGNLPPTVAITVPPPGSLLIPVLPPTFRIHWVGTDRDPVLSPKPVKYKWILLGSASEFPIDVAFGYPDSLRRHYAPTFAGWDSTGRDSTSIRLTNLTPNQEYLFVVIAFDELGDYSPVFSITTNMLRFQVSTSELLGPRLSLYNEFFNRALRPGYSTDPARQVPLEVRPGPVTIRWSAVALLGADLIGYRWALDLDDVFDQTPRTGDSDVRHWSATAPRTSGWPVEVTQVGGWPNLVEAQGPSREAAF